MLIILGGLPASGKTTLAKALTAHYHATYLRVDTIEQTIRNNMALPKDIGPIGYQLAYAIAEENLRLNQWVISDTVNSLNITREAWRSVAIKANKPFIEIEIICSDKTLHQQRAEKRSSNIKDLILPTWQAIMARTYEPWLSKDITVDTAKMNKNEAVKYIIQTITKQLTQNN